MPDSFSDLQAFSGALSQAVAGAAANIVAVRSHRARSSGFVWRPGLVVTADEALAEDGEVAVTLPGGKTIAASIAGRDPSTDVAVLRIEADTPAMALVPATPFAGALCMAVGAKDGGAVASLGIVSFAGPAWRSLRGGEIAARIELDLRMQRVAEGGVVLDAAGQAFGMAVFGPQRRALAIPAATIERVAAMLAAEGRIMRGYLGLGLQQVRLADGGTGLMVMSIDPKGPGAAADIRQGDVVLASDGQALRGMRDLQLILGPSSVGKAVTLSLSRGGQPAEVALTIGARDQG